MITVVSCWYELKAKFNNNVYREWIKNFISIVNNFNLVIFTDKNSYNFLKDMVNGKNNIKIVLYEIEEFYNYKYKDYWIINHQNNHLLNQKICWQLSMLWSEKIFFIKKTKQENYFNTNNDWYIWCDIGYFRNRWNDSNTLELQNWCHTDKFNNFNKNSIYYGLVNKNINNIIDIINNENEIGLPKINIPPDQISVAGGFFIIHKDNIEWWSDTYDQKLQLYFKNDYLVKDDQIIIINCIIKNRDRFILCEENNSKYNNWFMFQRILS
jgi:hypothetical protein